MYPSAGNSTVAKVILPLTPTQGTVVIATTLSATVATVTGALMAIEATIVTTANFVLIVAAVVVLIVAAVVAVIIAAAAAAAAVVCGCCR